MRLLIIGLGGFFGAVARYLVDGWVMSLNGTIFPLGTLIINTSGAFILGFFYELTLSRFTTNPNWRLFIAIGVLGAYTTFSTFSYETVKLIENGSIAYASVNVLAGIFGGLAAIYLGTVLARLF